MQNNKISKSLEALFARATFRIEKSEVKHSYKDILFIELLSPESGMAYQLLWSLLEDWQLFQLRLRLDSVYSLSKPEEEATPVEFFTSLGEQMRAQYPNAATLSTLHALHFVLNDRATVSSRASALYNLTAGRIEPHIAVTQRASNPKMWGVQHTQVQAHTSVKEEAKPTHKPHMAEQFGVDLTQLARQGKIDPVVGRTSEVERVIQLLARKKKNNPVLIGEAGVGKSAIAEGLALKIVSGDVPQTLAGKRLISLDVAQLVAGTKFRGEFEERMNQLIDSLRKSPEIVLFIDEIHTIVGAGSTQSSLDGANILKPALARGEIQVLGATTLDEYRTSIESDAALERRFQKVLVEPTTEGETLEILQNIAPSYEAFHGVKYTAEALEACVSLAARYITDRAFPDKAIDLLDEVGARHKVAQVANFEPVHALEAVAAGAEELSFGQDFLAMQTHSLESIHAQQSLNSMYGQPPSRAEVGARDVHELISSMMGLPSEQLTLSDRERILQLRSHLERCVIGQSEAIEVLSNSIMRSRAGLGEPSRPMGVFMFAGATGVGKTLLAKELSRWMFDKKDGLIRIDMSEYSQRHNVARLIGSPPGYVGYGEGGQLTEAVRREPYSVVLFDEIEKAHPDVFNIMLQIFDEGHLTDGSGRKVDFKNTIIILTSNVGSQLVAKQRKQVGYSTQSKHSVAQQRVQSGYKSAMEKRFSPEFLNRLDDVVHFRSLESKDIEKIVDLEITALAKRSKKRELAIRITPSARKLLAELGFESKYGARALRRTIIEHVEHPLSRLIISGEVQSGDTVTIAKSRGGNELKFRVN